MTTPTSIDQVIEILEGIIVDSSKNNDPLGYFAVLYQKVTKKVKEGIANKFFDDNERMEKLDIVFASRYLDAYFAYKNGQPTTHAWAKAFQLSTHYWPIVLQHLLIGINAHINLDLGIAVAEIMKGKNIDDIESDFNKINEILAGLVDEVENDVADVWPTLKWILKVTGGFDNFLVNFSMKLARNGAWKFSTCLAEEVSGNWDNLIEVRDGKVTGNAEIVTDLGLIASLIFGIVRLGERGTVAQKINKLKQ